MKTSLSEGEEKEKGAPGYEGDLAPGATWPRGGDPQGRNQNEMEHLA